MSEIAKKNDNLEKFRSDIAKVVEGEGKEGGKKEVDKLATLLDYNFDSRYSPALEEAMENMKIERQEITQVSLDDLANQQRTSNFMDNISVTLNAHGELAEQHSTGDKEPETLHKFGKQAKQIGRLIEELPRDSLNTATNNIKAVTTVRVGTEGIYSQLESSRTKEGPINGGLVSALIEYIKSFFTPHEKQRENLIDSSKKTINAIKDVPHSDKMRDIRARLEKILNDNMTGLQADRLKKTLKHNMSEVTSANNSNNVINKEIANNRSARNTTITSR